MQSKKACYSMRQTLLSTSPTYLAGKGLQHVQCTPLIRPERSGLFVRAVVR